MAEEAKLKSQMGSDEPVKFTDEELSSLRELQNTYASISTQFGQVKVSRINLERQIENLDDAENQLESITGTISIEEAKIGGITPAMFNFNGR